MVEVFKTNVQCLEDVTILAKELSSAFPCIKINFDLEDCDKVLRVEGEDLVSNKIINMINSSGYLCQVLE
jgi:hypothetical protein